MSYTRFAVYYLPAPGALAAFGAEWLGWDVERGAHASQPDVPGLDDITMTPRKYGFHGTLKPPFRLAEGTTFEGLTEAVEAMAQGCAPAQAPGLRLARLGNFLALVPEGDQSGIARVAAACVTELDAFRAPAGEAELARRRKAGLSARQEELLRQWGYPYVLEEFRFHLTLSGRLEGDTDWEAIAAAHLPPLPAPFEMSEVALTGERADGRFELIQRYALTG